MSATNPASAFGLRFDNRFVRELPGEPASLGRSPRRVVNACYARVSPEPVSAPQVVAYSREVASSLGLTEDDCRSEAFARLFAGNALAAGMAPYAACYGGHQFGSWAGQLGDGRAITLGEALVGEGARERRLELQLKGAGRTPFSRTADGRAVLRSSLREFVCSEAMHHLGVPTTRALSLIETGDSVVRDMLYDGHPRAEPGAVVCRVAESFLRFGNYELLTSRDEVPLLKALVDHTLMAHAPHLPLTPDGYARFFAEVCEKTADLIVHWMRVGFVHGVMNTDNMSILGLTVDYGPFGFLDSFDPNFTPNTTDAGQRRYRYSNQPRIAQWNLHKLAEALYPLIADPKPLESALDGYGEAFGRRQRAMLASKLGFASLRGDDGPAGDDALVDDLFTLMVGFETDFTIFFRALAEVPIDGGPEAPAAALLSPVAPAFYLAEPPPPEQEAAFVSWLRRYVRRAAEEAKADAAPHARTTRMHRANPKYVLRNYQAQLAIDAAEAGDRSKVAALLEVLRRPYDEQPEHAAYAAKRPEWARQRVGCSMLSCSS